MRWICPATNSDPRPPVRTNRDPSAVVIGTPPSRDRRVPHVPIRTVVLPRAVLIESRCIGLHLAWQVLRRYSKPLISSCFRPPIEPVPRRRVEGVGVRGRGIGTRIRPLTRTKRGPAIVIHEFRGAAKHG